MLLNFVNDNFVLISEYKPTIYNENQDSTYLYTS